MRTSSSKQGQPLQSSKSLEHGKSKLSNSSDQFFSSEVLTAKNDSIFTICWRTLERDRGRQILKFPEYSAMNLEGRKLRLPDDLEGKMNVVILAFRREQQDSVDEWIRFLEGLVREYEILAYYEIPTINVSYSLFRWMIDGGMRAGIADRKVRKRTITLYVDKKEFKRRLEIDSEESIIVLLLRNDGEILWRTVGHHSEDKGLKLRSIVEKEN